MEKGKLVFIFIVVRDTGPCWWWLHQNPWGLLHSGDKTFHTRKIYHLTHRGRNYTNVTRPTWWWWQDNATVSSPYQHLDMLRDSTFGVMLWTKSSPRQPADSSCEAHASRYQFLFNFCFDTRNMCNWINSRGIIEWSLLHIYD